jgi:hypothetical protein
MEVVGGWWLEILPESSRRMKMKMKYNFKKKRQGLSGTLSNLQPPTV